MAISYKKLWHRLLDCGMTKTDLQKKAGISWSSVSKLNKGESISTAVLEKICLTLKCSISDILEFEAINLNDGAKTENSPVQNSAKDAPAVQHKKFTFIDLFAGIGGFHIAMEKNGGECVFASEWDKYAQETYSANFPTTPLYGDITLPETKSKIPDQFDVLCAGFPCQAFSHAGLKKGFADTRGTLFHEIAEILDTHHPKVAFLENVRGLISHDSGRTLQTILQTITRLGYSCNISSTIINGDSPLKLQNEAKKMVLLSREFGVCQNRQRIYIVLWRNDLTHNGQPITHFNYPLPTNEETKVASILDQNVDARYTISDRMWIGHQERKKRNKENGKGFGYSMVSPDSPYTNTISARYWKDGSEILIEQPGKNPRVLTPREAIRLQGFPDSFILNRSEKQTYKQAGNSVSVPVVCAVASQIAKELL